MPTVAKKLVTNTLTTVSTDSAYTVPTGTKAIVKNILVSNLTTVDRLVNVAVAGKYLMKDYTLTAKNVVSIDLSLVMEAGTKIEAWCPDASAVDIHISGVEVS